MEKTQTESSQNDLFIKIKTIKAHLALNVNELKKVFCESRRLMYLSRKGPECKRENAAAFAKTKKDLVALHQKNEGLKKMLTMYEKKPVIDDASSSLSVKKI